METRRGRDFLFVNFLIRSLHEQFQEVDEGT